MKKLEARFLKSAVRPEHYPPDGPPEYAFLGRSNVGKSSLLNTLTGVKGLAKTSNTPGRTQLINFFDIGELYRFVDLPGYGYARAPGEVTRQWRAMIEAYLRDRQSLVLCLLLLDARRGWMEPDLSLREWLEAQGRPYLVVATKFDKLKSQKERHEGLVALRKHIAADSVIPCSAVTGDGLKEVWKAISDRRVVR